MALKKCLGCNTFIDASEGKDYCSNCMFEHFNQGDEEQQETLYLRVREYLLENPRTPKTVIADIMNISVKVIDKWIREGKIEEVEGMMASPEKKSSNCTKCGKKIQSGILCDNCKKEFQQPAKPDEGINIGFRSSVKKDR